MMYEVDKAILMYDTFDTCFFLSKVTHHFGHLYSVFGHFGGHGPLFFTNVSFDLYGKKFHRNIKCQRDNVRV